MCRRSHPSRSLIGLILSGVAIASVLGTLIPARSHQIQISGQVGGTLHIEPNDTPRARRPALTWFALTRQGGQVIPLADCDCRLAIYTGRSRQLGQAPLGLLSLQPLSTGQYQNIPATTIVFPQVGQYELVLQGRPINPGDFNPFVLPFPVTVTR